MIDFYPYMVSSKSNLKSENHTYMVEASALYDLNSILIRMKVVQKKEGKAHLWLKYHSKMVELRLVSRLTGFGI